MDWLDLLAVHGVGTQCHACILMKEKRGWSDTLEEGSERLGAEIGVMLP